MNRFRHYFRQRLTPALLTQLVEDMAVSQAQLLQDTASLGVVGTALPVQDLPFPTMNLLVPILTAYVPRSGLRIWTASEGRVDLTVQGDFRPNGHGYAIRAVDEPSGPALSTLTLPPSGQERWITLGIMPHFELTQKRTDGYGEDAWERLVRGFKFRVVHGTPAPVGTATRPDAAWWKNGLILADALVGSSTTSITTPALSYSRLPRFRWRKDAFQMAGGGGLTPNLETRNFTIPGAAFTDTAHVFKARFPGRLARLALTSVYAVAPPGLRSGPPYGDTVLEFSQVSDFSDPARLFSVTVPQGGTDAKVTGYLELAGSDALFCRVQTGGGHEWLNVTLELDWLELTV